MSTVSDSERGYASMMPAEWVAHRATWLAWPHARGLWGDEHARVIEEFIALCRLIGRSERLEILVHETIDPSSISERLFGLDVVLHRARYGDIWLRDTAPLFVRHGDTLEAVAFRFNGWGGKYRLEGDTEVAAFVAEKSEVALRQLDWIGEGGALDFDGAGACMASSACLLSRERNPELTRQDIERSLHEAFGTEQVVWLDQILLGDHTDGHVDTLARFVAADTVVCAQPNSVEELNAEALKLTRRQLEAAGRFDIVTLPSPGRVLSAVGEPLPASYLNFYVANDVVAVPTYARDSDDEAVASIAELFPGREVVGLSARAILEGGGAFHCITQQEPEVRA